jgi:hypothetical protein
MCQIDRYGYIVTAGQESVVKVWNTNTNTHQHAFRTCDTAVQLASRSGNHDDIGDGSGNDILSLSDESDDEGGDGEEENSSDNDTDDRHKEAADQLQRRMQGMSSKCVYVLYPFLYCLVQSMALVGSNRIVSQCSMLLLLVHNIISNATMLSQQRMNPLYSECATMHHNRQACCGAYIYIYII